MFEGADRRILERSRLDRIVRPMQSLSTFVLPLRSPREYRCSKPSGWPPHRRMLDTTRDRRGCPSEREAQCNANDCADWHV